MRLPHGKRKPLQPGDGFLSILFPGRFYGQQWAHIELVASMGSVCMWPSFTV